MASSACAQVSGNNRMAALKTVGIRRWNSVILASQSSRRLISQSLTGTSLASYNSLRWSTNKSRNLGHESEGRTLQTGQELIPRGVLSPLLLGQCDGLALHSPRNSSQAFSVAEFVELLVVGYLLTPAHKQLHKPVLRIPAAGQRQPIARMSCRYRNFHIALQSMRISARSEFRVLSRSRPKKFTLSSEV